MKCDRLLESIPLYYYGELAAEDEERFEDHLSGCDSCRRETERYRQVAGALDRREAGLPPGLVAECRHELMRSVYRAEAPPASSAWTSFREGFAALFGSMARFRQPLAAAALLALGFFSARLITTPQHPQEPLLPAADVVYSSIRSVQPDGAGRVQIAVDETRRRVVSGNPDDGNIRRLLLAGMREEDNPAVRVESVGLLKDRPASTDIRAALENVALHDPAAAVRLKAIEGLKSFASQPDVRRVLSQVLMNDENPGVRIQAIDLLVGQRDESMVGVLQNVVQKENNGYVRMKCERALKDMNASIGTF
jgi:hypothetical protein